MTSLEVPDPLHDREAQFLASQQARLDKIRNTVDHNNFSSTYGCDNNDDIGIQQQRKDFWSSFKIICLSLDSRLSTLMGVDANVDDDVKDSNGTNNLKDNEKQTEFLYVTTQQRNEALGKLQEIQMTIKCLADYSLNSKSLSDKATFLPPEFEKFTKNAMPELPKADLRLLNTEIQQLKHKCQQTQSVIIPQEKFIFRRYRAQKAARLSSSAGGDAYDGTIINENYLQKFQDDTSNDNVVTSSKEPLFAFDGVTLESKSDCSVKVERDGNFVFSSKDENISETNNNVLNDKNHTSLFTESKAFLIRDLNSCNVLVEGTYSSLHIINIKDCTIRMKTPIPGPVHVTNCHDTSIHLAFCRQLRIHDCTNVRFYIHATSGPIIEGCKDMKFYQCDYVSNGIDNFEKEQNLYWDVKDFHWLKNLVKSPNFDVHNEMVRKKEEEVEKMKQSRIKLENMKMEDRINSKIVKHEQDLEVIAGEIEEDESSDDDEL